MAHLPLQKVAATIKVSSPGIGRAPPRSGGPSTFAGSHAHPAHPEDKSVSRPGFEPGRGPSEGRVPLRSSGRLSATSSGREHEREDSDPVNQFWRLAALPGAHSYLFCTQGIRRESNPCLLVHSQACRNRYTTETINGYRHEVRRQPLIGSSRSINKRHIPHGGSLRFGVHQHLVPPQQDDGLLIGMTDHRQVRKVRGEGIEPSSSASKAGGLPLADPRTRGRPAGIEPAFPAWKAAGTDRRLVDLPLGQGHIHSCGRQESNLRRGD